MTVTEKCNNYIHALCNFINLSCNFKLSVTYDLKVFQLLHAMPYSQVVSFLQGQVTSSISDFSVSTSHQPLNTETETVSDALNMNSTFAWTDQLRMTYQSFPFHF